MTHTSSLEKNEPSLEERPVLKKKTMSRFVLNIILLFAFVMMPESLLGESNSIKIVGSSTILPIVKHASKAFHRMTGIRIVYKGGGSMAGVRAALEGSADIGMVSRSHIHDEASRLQAHLIGHDGIAVILNTTIPLNEISRQQIVDIFSGTIINWKAFGGKDMEITVIAKEDGRSTRRLFDNFFNLKKVVSTAQIIGSNTEAIILVAGDPTAIGYVSIGSAEHAVALGLNLKLLPLDEVPATTENVASEQYPLRRPLNLVTLGKPGKNAGRFIKFIQGEQGQEFVQKNHFIVIKKRGIAK